MALPQRDNRIEAIKRTDALLEAAVMRGDEAEAERLGAKLRGRRRCERWLVKGDEKDVAHEHGPLESKGMR